LDPPVLRKTTNEAEEQCLECELEKGGVLVQVLGMRGLPRHHWFPVALQALATL
jgi:hypothetical protein